jgi:hypothetical protein
MRTRRSLGRRIVAAVLVVIALLLSVAENIAAGMLPWFQHHPVVFWTATAALAVAVISAQLVRASAPRADAEASDDIPRDIDDHPEPTRPIVVLDQFLRRLGVTESEIPGRLDEAAALYRRMLSGKRALVLLDNAADEAQVRPLLPAARRAWS